MEHGERDRAEKQRREWIYYYRPKFVHIPSWLQALYMYAIKTEKNYATTKQDFRVIFASIQLHKIVM